MSTAWELEVVRDDGSVACRRPFRPGWRTASAWVRFQGIRRGLLPPMLDDDCGEVVPVWDDERGAPYVSGARIVLRDPNGAPAVCETVPIACLAEDAADVLRALVHEGVLADGEVVRPRVCAEPRPTGDPAAVAGGGGIGIEPLPVELPLHDTPLAPLLARATPRDVHLGPGDAPVFLPARVLDEVTAAARVTPDLESGGFLLGRLHRDAAVPECFVEVTGRIAARHVVAGRTKLTFTPDTWAAAEVDAAARGRGERIVAWHHFHPFWCRPCPVERRRACALDGAAFSADDVRLHALGFGQPYATALLAHEREDGSIAHALYGWRRGVVAPRGYHVLDAGNPSATAGEVPR